MSVERAAAPVRQAARRPDLGHVLALLLAFLRLVAGTVRDLAPVVLVVAFFQIVVLRQGFPNLEAVIVGLVLVMAGLALFLKG